ncbi:MAG: hypothetical protein WCG27_06410 [Pseudomonadota bacterium]
MIGEILPNNNKKATDLLLPVDQQKQFKKRQNFKIFSALLVTNLLVALSVSSCPPISNSRLPSTTYVNHDGFIKVNLPLILYVPLEDKSEIPISLFDPQRKLVLSKAYLHQKKNIGDSSSNTETVEVPAAELKKLVNVQEPHYLAFPFQEKAMWGEDENNNRPKDSYEIRL